MKKAIIVLSILGFLSCENQNTSVTDKPYLESDILKRIEQQDSIARNTNEVIKRIFLDFQFGMTKEDYVVHANKLLSKGKLKFDSVYYANRFSDKPHWGYFYEFTPSNREYEVTSEGELSPYFLYDFGMTGMFINFTNIDALSNQELVNLFKEKYGKSITKKDKGSLENIWYESNIKITLSSSYYRCTIWFSDMSKMNEIKEIQKMERKGLEEEMLKEQEIKDKKAEERRDMQLNDI